MAELFPEGLTQKEFSLLTKCSKEATEVPLSILLTQARTHLEKVRQESVQNIFVNLKLAEAIFINIQEIVKQ